MLLGAPENDKSKKVKDFRAVCHCTFVFFSFSIPSPPVIMFNHFPHLFCWVNLCLASQKYCLGGLETQTNYIIQIKVCPVSDNTKTNLFFVYTPLPLTKLPLEIYISILTAFQLFVNFFVLQLTKEKKYLTSTLEEVLSAEVFFSDVIKSCLKPCPTFSVESPDGFAACTTDFIHWCFSKCQQGVVFQN